MEGLHWLGHSGFRWSGSSVIYFDPWKISGKSPKAGIILVSHEHFDHCSKVDIGLVATKETTVVTTAAASAELRPVAPLCKEIRAVAPGAELEIGGVKIRTVPSYNMGKPFHPKSGGRLGFVVTMDGVTVYHAGDTDAIPEMGKVRCDVALLPVSGTYVMTADEAASAARAIRPKAVVPMHYGDIVGGAADAKKLQALLKGKINVEVLKKEE